MLACLQLCSVWLLTFDIKIQSDTHTLVCLVFMFARLLEVSLEGLQSCSVMTYASAKVSVQYVLMHLVVQLVSLHLECAVHLLQDVKSFGGLIPVYICSPCLWS